MIKIGIVGYGNLGRGAELALRHCPDMTLTAIFTRREVGSITPATEGIPVLPVTALDTMADPPHVLILCGGSAQDLPHQTPGLAARYHVVDSYDNHSRIPEHFAAVDAAARSGGRVAVIAAGWDPGLFSLARLYAQAILPRGATYTFWGEGVSQGHSDAIRRVPGVQDGRQYTLPVPEAVARVQAGEQPQLSAREKHTRLCYVVAQPGADTAAIERAIVTMPAYFADYDTTVHFITQEELERDHSGLPHGGRVLRSGTTGQGDEHGQLAELRLALGSNPEFTASVLVTCARAAYRMAAAGMVGCQTMLDIPPALLAPESRETLMSTLL